MKICITPLAQNATVLPGIKRNMHFFCDKQSAKTPIMLLQLFTGGSDLDGLRLLWDQIDQFWKKLQAANKLRFCPAKFHGAELNILTSITSWRHCWFFLMGGGRIITSLWFKSVSWLEALIFVFKVSKVMDDYAIEWN